MAENIVVGPTGEIRAIDSPKTRKVLRAVATASKGDIETRRASHVETNFNLSDAAVAWLFEHGPYKDEKLPFDTERKILLARNTTEQSGQLRKLLPKDRWYADMLPVNGPVLGPYDDKETALAEEVVWLKAHGIPFCEPCIQSETTNAPAQNHGPVREASGESADRAVPAAD